MAGHGGEHRIWDACDIIGAFNRKVGHAGSKVHPSNRGALGLNTCRCYCCIVK